MKILYVVSGQSYSSENPSRKINSMVRCWRGLGHEVELICGNDVMPTARQATVKKLHSDLSKPPWYRKSKLLAPLVNTVSEYANIKHDKRLARVVTDRIRQFQPDIYLQRSSRIDGRTLNAALTSGVPTVLEWKDNYIPSPGSKKALRRGDLYGMSLFKPYVRSVEKWKEANTNYFVVESDVLKQSLSRYLNRDADRFYVSHNAVNFDDFSSLNVKRELARQELGLPEDWFITVFIGSFNWYQRVELLVEVIASESCSKKIHAVLVGDGEERKKVEQYAAELGVLDRVHFIGKVPYEKVPRYLAAADTAILPDCTEIITPIKVQEYMAMGIASLVPDYDANREVIEDGKTGFLFPARDVAALTELLNRLCESPDQCAAIGQAAMETAKEKFSWEATWGKTIESIAARNGVSKN